MGRGVGPVVSHFYERLHREEGVQVHTGVAVRSIEAGQVVCDGSSHPADLVLIGTGAVPNVELARAADLTVEDGITVDAECRTSDPTIYAIGDCTTQHHALFARRLRLGSVHNALEQGRIAARRSAASPHPSRRCRGSGRINTTSSCRWSGCQLATTRPWCAVIRSAADRSPSSTCARAR
jgi:3-phenylpropionate/trans-cinnamate dioxygenase ferredoxin reductase subunit